MGSGKHTRTSPVLTTIALVVLLPATLCGPTPLYSAGAVPVSGTLVIAVSTRDGLVITADKRIPDSRGGYVDSYVKISQVDKFTATVITGTAYFADPVTLKPVFDPQAIALQFLRQFDLTGDLSKHWKLLAQHLQRKFIDFWKPYYPAKPGLEPDNSLFQIAVFHYDTKEKRFRVTIMKLFYRETVIGPDAELSWRDADDIHFVTSRPMPLGQMEVYDEVKSGKDVRFDPWRHMKAIRKLLQHDLPIAKVSKEDALAFSSQMIKASSIMWPLVKPTKPEISQNVDSAIISPITGFKWLRKAE